MAMSSSLRRLRLITFDVTNTLVQFRASPGKQYGEIGALFGVLADSDALAQSFKANWYKMNRIYPNFGRNCRMDWQHWWRQLIGNTFADGGAKIAGTDKLDSLAAHLLDLYKTSICWEPCNGSLDLLNYLRLQQQLAVREKSSGQGPPFVLGVVSNFDPRLNELLRNMKLEHFFEFALNSYERKVEKPDKGIFELAMSASELAALKPSECLHIGDGPTTDYMGAKAAGWNAALIHERSATKLQQKYGDKIDEHFVFPSLYDFHKKLSNGAINW